MEQNSKILDLLLVIKESLESVHLNVRPNLLFLVIINNIDSVEQHLKAICYR